MKKTIKLSEQDLTRIIRRVIKESMWTSTSTWGNLSKKPSDNQSNSFYHYMEELRELEHRLQSGNISDEEKFHMAKDLVNFYEELTHMTKFDDMDDEDLEEYGHNFTLSETQLSDIFEYIREMDSEYDLGFMELLRRR